MKSIFKLQKKLTLTLLLLLSLTGLAYNSNISEVKFASAAPPPPCTPIGTTKDMKVDFGALGDGITDDSQAFKRASDWINANWSASSSIKIVVPAGTYVVGHQIRKGDIWNYGTGSINNQSQSYLGVRVFDLMQANNVIIEGAPNMGTRIIYKNGLIYGGYRTDIDQTCTARGTCNNCPNWNDVATVGTFIFLDQCSCISVSNFWVEGRYNMCDRKGMVGECGTIQLEYDGILISGGSDIDISNVTCANFGRDGLMSYYTNGSNVTNLTLNNFISSGNGRQGYSLVSGINVMATNCDFILTGDIKDGAIYPGNPQAGVDIEPDQGGVVNNCKFIKCRMTANRSYAFTTNNYFPSKITLDSCFLSSLNGYALWPSGMIQSTIKNSTILGKVTHVLGSSPSDPLIIENNFFTDWFGSWDTPVTTIWAQNNLPNGSYMFDLPNNDNKYYFFKDNTIELHHSKLLWTNGNNVASERVWENNTFNFSSTDLLDNTQGYPDTYDSGLFGHLGQFRNCTLFGNQFNDLTPTLNRNQTFYIQVKAQASPHPSTDNVTDGMNFWGPDSGPYGQIEYNPNWLNGWGRNIGFW